MDKKVSIIVPVFNIDKYIGRCLDSILKQSYKNIEVICVNDGSTDESLKILNKYLESDNRIKIIDQKNQGVSSARNNGIDSSTGEYIMFVDGDDFIEINMLEDLMNEAKNNDADIVKSSYVKDYIFKQEIISMNLGKERVVISENEKQDKIYPLFINNYTLNSMWAQIIKREIITEYNIKIDEKYVYGEDAEFNYQLYTYAKNIVLLDKPYYHYYHNTESATTTINMAKISRRLDDILKVHNELYNFSKLWDIENLKTDIANRIIREFIIRSREYFVLLNNGIDRDTIRNEIEKLYKSDIIKKSIEINNGNDIKGLNKECKIYSKYALSGNIAGYVKLGTWIYRIKRLIKKI